MSELELYRGRVVTIRPEHHAAYIGIKTLAKANGTHHGLKTTQDIFVHQDDCDSPSLLAVGLELVFEIEADKIRKKGTKRAKNVQAYIRKGELVPAEEAGLLSPSFGGWYVPPTEKQSEIKPVPDELVRRVIENNPMPRMPRRHEQPKNLATILTTMAETLFPEFSPMFASLPPKKRTLKDMLSIVQINIERHKALSLTSQAASLENRFRPYRKLIGLAPKAEGALDTLVPIEYLVDLFPAVPIWYFLKTKEESSTRIRHEHKYFCGVMPGQRWTDTFLMFNRRLRVFTSYKGDSVPLPLMDRMESLRESFDHLVIMTPYLSEAGRDWEDFSWASNPDPYVIGFIEGVPWMFVIGRFSDSGIFPGYHELVGDTMMFLRQNNKKLQGFDSDRNGGGNIEWVAKGQGSWPHRLGDHLVNHSRELLAAFDRRELFSWLRGEEPSVIRT